ncbi:MAG: PepSY domain-containing protein [Myxococcota bacterium]
MLRSLRHVALLLVLLATGSAEARDKDEIPPANAKPLSEVIETIEAEGHTVITEVKFDDWTWIVQIYESGLEFEIRVEPLSGEISNIRPI